jgi:glycosyltransferase involved in cell wall biosynthesis
MMDLEGSIRPALYLAEELARRGFKVSMLSPIMSEDVERYLLASGIVPISLNAKLVAKNFRLSLLWFETWAREAFLKLNSKHGNRQLNVTVNFSHTLIVPAMFWYLQGPTSAALRDMEEELPLAYKTVYRVLRSLIEYADGKLVRNMSDKSMFAVANSKFCASMYQKWGIEVDGVIYPPIDCKVFQPQISQPSSDYVLTYFGKETKFSVVKTIADLGVSIRAFGSKTPYIPRYVFSHPNIKFLGRVSIEDLVDLYSNALFTLFPFNHEPFGYVPVESMACGTPILTYDAQGPRESVIDNHTGWLVKNDAEIVSKALMLWKEGIDYRLRSNCRREALKFDREIYVKKWFLALKKNGCYNFSE